MPPGDARRPQAPPAWRDTVSAYRWHRQKIGLSGADVFRLEARGQPTLFVKAEPVDPFSEVQAEAVRLRWLAGRGIACPRVLEFAVHAGRNWLLTTALAGRDMASMPHGDAANLVRVVADALRALHAEPTEDCPFDHSLQQRIALVHARLAAGAIDSDDFDEEGGAAEALATLLITRPVGEDLVLTHGDACLPNFLIDAGRFSGFVDCGRVGVADRYQDLALACDSIGETLGEAWINPFLAHYGVAAPDLRRLAFYQQLDAFF